MAALRVGYSKFLSVNQRADRGTHYSQSFATPEAHADAH
jgi:hypothetical protein